MKKNVLSCFAVVGALSFGLLAGCATGNQAPVVEPTTPPPVVVETTEVDDEVELTNDILRADIVVIGAGGAGMTAALAAYQAGAENVVVLEQMPMVGGNTLLATGGMNAAGTSFQDPDSDTPDLMFEDTMRGGGNLNIPELVRIMADESADAVYWLNDLGAGLYRVGRGGGASAARFHGPADGTAVGPAVVRTLHNSLLNAGIPIMLNTTATELLVDSTGAIAGVVVERAGETLTIETTAIILASGGFGANSEMLVRYDSTLDGFGTTNHVGATGSGIEIAREIGASVIDMELIQTHPTVNPETSIMFTEAMRGDGAILINKEGERFVDELGTRDVLSEATLAQTGNVGLLLFDSRTRSNLGVIQSYINAGIIESGDSPGALAEALGIDPSVLEATIARYNELVEAGEDTDFGRTASMHVLEGPYFYAGITGPAVHHTMGGVRIDESTAVINYDGNEITGLFAAGEVVGGIHGDNRLGGNAVSDIIVFGRIAGVNAADFVRGTTGFTARTIAAEAQGQQGGPAAGVSGNFTDGVFVGVGQGYAGEIWVSVTVENGNIVSITLDEHNETIMIYNAAEEGVVNAIINTQSTNVDTVSGATVTSYAIIEAVEDALGL
ncbi:MAG: flavocytochrome c [Defluviitaleaceae bacterium]|nr:flavocytochrome c [Defluviitaleaceae bacterium]